MINKYIKSIVIILLVRYVHIVKKDMISETKRNISVHIVEQK